MKSDKNEVYKKKKLAKKSWSVLIIENKLVANKLIILG